MVLTWQNIALCLSSTVPGFTRSVHKDSPSTLSPRARVIRSRYIYQLCQSPGHCYRPLKWREMFHLGMNRCGEIRVVGLKRRNGRKVTRQNFVRNTANQRSQSVRVSHRRYTHIQDLVGHKPLITTIPLERQILLFEVNELRIAHILLPRRNRSFDREREKLTAPVLLINSQCRELQK